ncbi:MAG: FeoB-associated Cys-rich membrane protein [Planctomycetes bacterium]|nr:FeoB-associated Cys-rich membrane protein [Planctomycetota bacterium]
MSFDWQILPAIGLVTISVGYLGFRAWLLFARKKSGGCGGGCSNCPTEKSGAGESFVPIDELMEQTKRMRP